MATLAGLLAQGVPQAEPLLGLHHQSEVTTPHNGEAYWFGLGPTAYTIRLPEGFEDRSSETHAHLDVRNQPKLGLQCRRADRQSQELGFRSANTPKSWSPG